MNAYNIIQFCTVIYVIWYRDDRGTSEPTRIVQIVSSTSNKTSHHNVQMKSSGKLWLLRGETSFELPFLLFIHKHFTYSDIHVDMLVHSVFIECLEPIQLKFECIHLNYCKVETPDTHKLCYYHIKVALPVEQCYDKCPNWIP